MKEYIKVNERPPSCFINKELLKNLCEFLSSQETLIKKENKNSDSLRILVSLKQKQQKRIVFDSYEEFLLEDIPNNLGYLSFSLGGILSVKNVEIILNPNHANSIIEIDGTDSTWVYGILGDLKDIFNKYSTQHGLLYRITGPLCFGIFFLLTSIYIITNIENILLDREKLFFTILLLYHTIITPFSIRFLTRVLFPLIEFDKVGKHKDVKKILLPIIVMIVGITLTLLIAKNWGT